MAFQSNGFQNNAFQQTIAAAIQKFVGFIVNVGQMMGR